MPKLIDSIYVHQPVEEADIPQRPAALSLVVRDATPRLRPGPTRPWYVPARAPLVRHGWLGGRERIDMTPFYIVALIAWLAVSYVFVIAG